MSMPPIGLPTMTGPLNSRAMADELMTLDTPLGKFLRGVRDGNLKQPAATEDDNQRRTVKFSEPASKPMALDYKMSDPYANQSGQGQTGRKNKYGDDMVSDQ